MEIGIDDRLCDADVSSSGDERSSGPTKRQRKSASTKTAAMKAELKALLLQPLIARGVSTRYITSGSRSIVDDVVQGNCELHLSCYP